MPPTIMNVIPNLNPSFMFLETPDLLKYQIDAKVVSKTVTTIVIT